MTWQDFRDSIPADSNLDLKRLKKAYDFADYAHRHQKRYTGEDYIIHPLKVASILSSWHLDQTIMEAALLHDTIEDTHVTLAEIEKEFGKEVAFLVDGVTKVGQVKLRNKTDKDFVENLRKMFVAMAKDIRVIIIRLADRLHNMRTLDAVPLLKQERIAQETLEVYAPLAERLGMGQIKGELEDLAFPYVLPQEHDWLTKLADPHLKHTQKLTDKAIKQLKKQLQKNQVQAIVHGRAKHKYSLYKKLLRPEINKDIEKIHDLVALRVITENKADCYASLGIIHDYWKPAPHLGVSDFIAQPKPNGYQSIHTKIFDHNGRIIEIQIRTEKMHHHAEFGAAAHFAYAEAKSGGASDKKLQKGEVFSLSGKMSWVKELATWQKEVQDSEEFVTDLKLDALTERIYVFSPLGDVYDLPAQATPVDFAYAVHTQLINHIQGAKVNGKMVSLDHPLKSGDMIEIIKTKQIREPARDWLQFVKTRRARKMIKKRLNIK